VKHRSRHAWSVSGGLLASTLLLVGGVAGAQSPAASGGAGPTPTCTPLPTLRGGWTSYSPLPSPAALAPITVFAAASLNKPFTIMGQAWAAQHAGSTLTFSFDASSALRTQIEQGAPVDAFASADLTHPQTLIDECLAPEPITIFASNHLVIVVPTTNPAGIASPADLGKPGVRIVGAGDDVPITRYAEQVIANLAATPGAVAGYADAVHANTVSREDNVAAVLAKIELGEGDAGIVYASDAASSTGVTAIPIPDDANVLARYGAVEVAGTTQPTTSEAFLGYLLGPEAQAILTQFGFLPPQ
jgi:molybdate transport system substrate-binding protein